MYNWSFLFVVLHKPTLLPSTFKMYFEIFILGLSMKYVQLIVMQLYM